MRGRGGGAHTPSQQRFGGSRLGGHTLGRRSRLNPSTVVLGAGARLVLALVGLCNGRSSDGARRQRARWQGGAGVRPGRAGPAGGPRPGVRLGGGSSPSSPRWLRQAAAPAPAPGGAALLRARRGRCRRCSFPGPLRTGSQSLPPRTGSQSVTSAAEQREQRRRTGGRGGWNRTDEARPTAAVRALAGPGLAGGAAAMPFLHGFRRIIFEYQPLVDAILGALGIQDPERQEPLEGCVPDLAPLLSVAAGGREGDCPRTTPRRPRPPSAGSRPARCGCGARGAGPRREGWRGSAVPLPRPLPTVPWPVPPPGVRRSRASGACGRAGFEGTGAATSPPAAHAPAERLAVTATVVSEGSGVARVRGPVGASRAEGRPPEDGEPASLPLWGPRGRSGRQPSLESRMLLGARGALALGCPSCEGRTLIPAIEGADGETRGGEGSPAHWRRRRPGKESWEGLSPGLAFWGESRRFLVVSVPGGCEGSRTLKAAVPPSAARCLLPRPRCAPSEESRLLVLAELLEGKAHSPFYQEGVSNALLKMAELGLTRAAHVLLRHGANLNFEGQGARGAGAAGPRAPPDFPLRLARCMAMATEPHRVRWPSAPLAQEQACCSASVWWVQQTSSSRPFPASVKVKRSRWHRAPG